MTFCPRSPPKHRTSKPHGPHSHGRGKSDYAHGMKGHQWKKDNNNTVCGRCGKVQ